MSLREELEKELAKYTTYACADARRFAGNIGLCQKNKRGEIIHRQAEDYDSEERIQLARKVFDRLSQLQEIDIQLAGRNAGASMGSSIGYSEKDIKHSAKNVNLSKSGVCTTFALAGADIVLRKKESGDDSIKRVEIVARPAGHLGTHCFVVVNRKMGSKLEDKSTWGDKALVVDPWLASLQNPVVYSVKEFSQTGFLDRRLEANFDTSTPSLAEDRKKRIEQEKAVRKAFKKCIDEEDTKALAALLKNTPDFEKITLGSRGLNVFTYAILNHKQKALDVLLENVPDKNKFVNQKLQVLLKYAIENHDFDFFKNVLKGVQLESCYWLIYDAFDLAKQTGDIRFFNVLFSELSQYEQFDEELRFIGYQIPLLQQKYPNLVFPYLLSLPLKDIKENIGRAEFEQELYRDASNILEDINAAYQKKLQLLKYDEDANKASKPTQSAAAKPDWRTPPPLPKSKLLFSKRQRPNDKEEELRKERMEDLEGLSDHLQQKYGVEVPVTAFAHINEFAEKYGVMLNVLHDYVAQYDSEKDKVQSEKVPSVRINRLKYNVINDEVIDLLTRSLESLGNLRDILSGVVCDENGEWVRNYTPNKIADLRETVAIERNNLEQIKAQRETALMRIELPQTAKDKIDKDVAQKFEMADAMIQEISNLLDEKKTHSIKPKKA